MSASRQRWQRDPERRAWAARQAARAHHAQLAWAVTVPIVVAIIPNDVVERACAHYGLPTIHPNQVVAFIRHHLTNYDALIRPLSIHDGDDRAIVAIIRPRVDAAIRDALTRQQLEIGTRPPRPGRTVWRTARMFRDAAARCAARNQEDTLDA